MAASPCGERTVWMYWESAENMRMPALAHRCVASARRHSNLVLVTEKSINNYVTPCQGVERLPHIAQRSHYYRALLLFAYGGMWLDVDTLVLRDLDPLFEALHSSRASIACTHVCATSKTHGTHVSSCLVQCLLSRKGAPANGAWITECERLIQTAGVDTLTYDALGSQALAMAFNKTLALESGEVMQLPEHLVFSTGWRGYMRYHNVAVEAEFQTAKPAAIVLLYGRFMYPMGRERPESLLGRLFELSGEEAPAKKQHLTRLRVGAAT